MVQALPILLSRGSQDRLQPHVTQRGKDKTDNVKLIITIIYLILFLFFLIYLFGVGVMGALILHLYEFNNQIYM